MSAGEVAWRFGQKRLSAYERRAFSKMEPVYAVGAYGRVPKANLSRLGIVAAVARSGEVENHALSLCILLELGAGMRLVAGFQ